MKVLVPAAASALLTGIGIQRWRTRESFIEDRISDLIEEVDATADIAVRYWSRLPSTEGAPLLEDRALEADVFARQTRIANMRKSVSDFLDKDSLKLLTDEGELFRALTGGDFKSPSRKTEADRFDNIRIQAATYINDIREARRRRMEQSIFKSLSH